MRKMAIRDATGAALLIVAAIAVAGCGGGSKSSAPPSATVTVPTTAPVTTTTAVVTTTSQSTTTASSSGGGGLKDCGNLTSFGREFAKALAASAGSGAAGLATQADAFKSFADHAPEEIRADLRIIGDAFAKYAEALKGVNITPGKVPSAADIAKLQAAAKEIDQSAVSAASQRVSTWVRSHCHA